MSYSRGLSKANASLTHHLQAASLFIPYTHSFPTPGTLSIDRHLLSSQQTTEPVSASASASSHSTDQGSNPPNRAPSSSIQRSSLPFLPQIPSPLLQNTSDDPTSCRHLGFPLPSWHSQGPYSLALLPWAVLLLFSATRTKSFLLPYGYGYGGDHGSIQHEAKLVKHENSYNYGNTNEQQARRHRQLLP